MALHLLQRGAERRRELLLAGEAQHARDPLQPLVGFRQRVRLLVVDHLDGMLDAAQEPVLPGQRVARLGGDPAALRQLAEHRHGRAAAQLRKTPAGDQLLRLDEELDLADAAAAELDVVPLHRDLAMALVRMDLALDRMDVGDRRVVHVFAPDVGLQLLQKRFARREVAGHRARLDHRGALPVLAAALVVGQRGLDRRSPAASSPDRDAGEDRCGRHSRARCGPGGCARAGAQAARTGRSHPRDRRSRAPPDRRRRPDRCRRKSSARARRACPCRG